MALSPVSRPAGTARPRRGGRPTAQETARLDRDVRECALRLFLEHGYDGTSMDAIALAANTTKASLYARFADKQDVFVSVLGWAIRRSDWPPPDVDPTDPDDLERTLTALAHGVLGRALDPTMISLARIAITHVARFPEIAGQAYSDVLSPHHLVVVDLLKRHAAAGTIVADEPEILAEHFLAMVAGMPARLASFGIVREPARQEQHTLIAVRLFVRGLQP